MKLNKKIATGGLVLGAIGATLVAGANTGTANASSVRKDIAIAGAATAIYGLLDHNNTAAVVGGVVTAGALAGGPTYYDYHYNNWNGRDWHGDRDGHGDRGGQSRDWHGNRDGRR